MPYTRQGALARVTFKHSTLTHDHDADVAETTWEFDVQKLDFGSGPPVFMQGAMPLLQNVMCMATDLAPSDEPEEAGGMSGVEEGVGCVGAHSSSSSSDGGEGGTCEPVGTGLGSKEPGSTAHKYHRSGSSTRQPAGAWVFLALAEKDLKEMCARGEVPVCKA